MVEGGGRREAYMSEQGMTAELTWCDTEIVARRPIRLFGLRDRLGPADLRGFPYRALPVVRQALHDRGMRAVGPATALLRPSGGRFEVTLAVPVTGRARPASPFVVVKLSGGLVAQLVHQGPWDTLLNAYDRLSEWLSARRVTAVPLMWEEYLVGPEQADDPSRWRTRIAVPLPVPTSNRAGR
jgi:hypothetical protein